MRAGGRAGAPGCCRAAPASASLSGAGAGAGAWPRGGRGGAPQGSPRRGRRWISGGATSGRFGGSPRGAGALAGAGGGSGGEQGARFVFVGGKGGVGKTTLSASLGTALAAEGHRTLVVSTDPAHSLGDAFGVELAGGEPVDVGGADGLPLYGLELDPELARERLLGAARKDGVKKGLKDALGPLGLGFLADQVGELGLEELLDTPPPGFDEAVAMLQIVRLARQKAGDGGFSRVVLDTAPTGHTLRLLAMPGFLDGSLGKLIELRQKISGTSSAIKGLFGLQDGPDSTLERLLALREEARATGALLQDPQRCEFVVATIPTVLGVEETLRLLQALKDQGVCVRRVVVNQCVGDDQGENFLQSRRKDQSRALGLLSALDLNLVQSFLLDMETRGLPALKYFGGAVWADTEVLGDLTRNGASDSRFVVVGGKGGVGKTTLSSSLGAQLAQEGLRTLVVSTDPAHSLGDAFGVDLGGGEPVRVDPVEPLWGLELDPELARQRLAEAVRGAAEGAGAEEASGSFNLGQALQQLGDLRLGELLDTPPPGTDELIAIASVLELLEAEEGSGNKFQRVVLDTAPTGHTLRLLTLPQFLDTALGKVVALRSLLGKAGGAIATLLGGQAGEDRQTERLEALRGRCRAVGELFRDSETTQFVIATVPTVLAARESARLSGALRREGVPLRTVVANQIVPEASGERFLETTRRDQAQAIATLMGSPLARPLQVTLAPLLDREARGVPALRYFAGVAWAPADLAQL